MFKLIGLVLPKIMDSDKGEESFIEGDHDDDDDDVERDAQAAARRSTKLWVKIAFRFKNTPETVVIRDDD